MLPVDCFSEIFSYCSWTELCALRATCRLFRQLTAERSPTQGIVVVGGQDIAGDTVIVQYYDGCRWTSLRPVAFPIQRSSNCVCLDPIGRAVWMVCEDDDLLRYDLRTMQQTRFRGLLDPVRATIPPKVKWYGICSISLSDGYLFAHADDRILSISVAGVTADSVPSPWQQCRPLYEDSWVHRRSGGCMRTVNGWNYIIGGFYKDWFQSWYYVHCIDTGDVLSKEAPDHSAVYRAGAGSCVYNECIYFAGGVDRMRSPVALQSFMRFDPRTDTWTMLADMPTVRTGVALVAHQDRLYAIGGDRFSRDTTVRMGGLFVVFDVVESYDVRTDTWRAEPSLLCPMTPCGGGAL